MAWGGSSDRQAQPFCRGGASLGRGNPGLPSQLLIPATQTVPSVASAALAAFGGVTRGGFPIGRPPVPARLPIPRFPGRLPGGAGGAIAGGVVSVVAEILARSRDATGRPVSAAKIRDAARACGLEVAAEMFGISTLDVCAIVIAKRRRRARGISASDMRRTRSTLRKISGLRKDVKAVTGKAF